jgi:ATP-binding cassette subfamily F protein 3
LHADGGDCQLPADWRIAHMRQEVDTLERRAVDYVLDGDHHLRRIQRELAQAEERHDGAAIAQLHHELDLASGYDADARARKLLAGLGFTGEQMERAVGDFSGGWRMRLNLAQALMCPSELLLLDEPTNHLDLDAILWLEEWLKSYPGTLLLISHDRDFLDAVVDHVAHLEQQKLTLYRGGYSAFERTRAERLAQQQQAYERQQAQRAHMEDFIRRFKAKASKARQAQSRIKALERLEELAPAHVDSPFSFRFREADKVSSPLLDLAEGRLGYGAKTVLDKVKLQLVPGARIGLLGPNGAGKSTLIKTLAGELEPLGGRLTRGENLAVGYFAQHQLDSLDPKASPLLHLQRVASGEREQILRDFLGGFDFRGERCDEPVVNFSGGEKARLALALIAWQKPNLLLLDEPTNHLDLETRHALTMALAQFEGTLILVSHDRHLLRATTDQFMLVAKHRLQPFDGDLDDYRDWLLQHAAEQRAALKDAAAGGDDAGDAGVNRKELRRQEAQTRQKLSQLKKPLQAKIGKIEKEMDTLNAEKGTLDAFVADPASYQPELKSRLTDAIRRQAEVQARLETLEADWLDAHEELEQIG